MNICISSLSPSVEATNLSSFLIFFFLFFSSCAKTRDRPGYRTRCVWMSCLNAITNLLSVWLFLFEWSRVLLDCQYTVYINWETRTSGKNHRPNFDQTSITRSSFNWCLARLRYPLYVEIEEIIKLMLHVSRVLRTLQIQKDKENWMTLCRAKVMKINHAWINIFLFEKKKKWLRCDSYWLSHCYNTNRDLVRSTGCANRAQLACRSARKAAMSKW